MLPLLCHMPQTPMPQVLQQWLLSAPPVDLMPEVPLAMASAMPTTGSAPPHLYAPTSEGPTSLASMSAFNTMPASLRGLGDMGDRCICHRGSCSPFLPPDFFNEPNKPHAPIHPHSAAHMQASCSAVVLAPVLLAAYTLAPLLSHVVISSPCLGNAASPIAVTATAIIAIIAITTVAITRALHSTFLFSPQCSPSAGELFSGCTGTSIVGCGHLHFFSIALPCLGSATSCVAIATTVIAIAIISVATTTRAPCSDRRSLRDRAIAPPEVLGRQECQAAHCRRDRVMTLTIFNVIFIYY